MNVAKEEKERFCNFAAALLSPPDEVLADDLQKDALFSWLERCAEEWGGEGRLPSALFREACEGAPLSVLKREYARLFVDTEGDRISLVESTYKPWTHDKECGMVFAGSTGLVMGDAALHMAELYERLSLEIPEDLRSTPDHVALELEFLGLLYRSASPEQVAQFIEDHLDWIGGLRAEVEKANPHPFYWNAIQLIDSFLQLEARNGEVN